MSSKESMPNDNNTERSITSLPKKLISKLKRLKRKTRSGRSSSAEAKSAPARPSGVRKKHRFPARTRKKIFFGVVIAIIAIIIGVTLGSCHVRNEHGAIMSQDIYGLARAGEYQMLVKAYNSSDVTDERKFLIEQALSSELESQIKNVIRGDSKQFTELVPLLKKVAPLSEKYYYLSSNSSRVKTYAKNFEKGLADIKEGDYGEGLRLINKIPDEFFAGISVGEVSYLSTKSDIYDNCISAAQTKYSSGDYDGCLKIAQSITNAIPGDSLAKSLVFSCSNLVEHWGDVEFLDLRPLIAYTDRAFGSDTAYYGQDSNMITAYEFTKILEQLYNNNYVLIDINQLFNTTYNSDGSVASIEENKLMLPDGKKPLVILVEDLNYYKYMREDGENYKLVLDSDGKVAAYSINNDGEEVISRENEIIPILDKFVEDHYDFSINGAKGCIGLTGYAGILGYATDDPMGENYASEYQEAKKVVDRLKATGWTFASHSQGHRHSNAISYETFTADAERWANEVGSIVGDTTVYIWPFGESVEHSDMKLTYLLQKGFSIFCSATDQSSYNLSTYYVNVTSRLVSGTGLKDARFNDIFEVPAVTDPERPWYNEWNEAYWSTGTIPSPAKAPVGEIYR